MEFSEKGYEFVEHELPFRYEEDGLHVTRGSAWTGPGCHEGCGVLMYTDDKGKLVKVEGIPRIPSTREGCASDAWRLKTS